MIITKIAYSYLDQILRFANLAFLGKDPALEEKHRNDAIAKIKIVAFKAIDDQNYDFIYWIITKENFEFTIKNIMNGKDFHAPPKPIEVKIKKYIDPDADIKKYLFNMTYQITIDDIKRYKEMVENLDKESDKERIERLKDKFILNTFGVIKRPKSKKHIRHRTKSKWDVF